MDAKQELELRRRLEAASSPREELEIRRQLDSSQEPAEEKSQKPPLSREGRGSAWTIGPDLVQSMYKMWKDPQKNIPEALLASRPVRFAGGAAGSALSGAQIIENTIRKVAPDFSRKLEDAREYVGLPRSMNEVIDRYEGNTQQARAAGGDTGFDPYALAGRIMDPVGLKVAKMLPWVRGGGLMGLGKNMLRSGAVGGVSAATTPVEHGDEDYFNKLGQRTATGAVLSAAIPPVAALGKGIFNFGRDMYRAVAPGGAKPLAIDALIKRTGEKNVPEVIKGLRVDARKLPGDNPSAGDLLVDVPAGSPIFAQQKATFAAEGGASNIAGKYKLAQQKVIAKAKESLKETMIPAKEKIFERVDKVGVKTDKILSGVDDILNKPDTIGAGSLAVKKVKRMIEKKATEGAIAAETLHKIRREGINEIIESFVKPGAKSSKKEAAAALKQVRDVIDDVIEQSGGKDWKQWLKTYEEAAKKISAVEGRVKLKPLQPTTVSGDIAKKEAAEFANVLWRPVTFANWLHKFGVKQGGGLAARIHEELAKGFINPQALADDLERAIIGKPSPFLDKLGIPTSTIVTNIMKKNKEIENGN